MDEQYIEAPASIHTEIAVLGAMILYPEAVEDALDVLKAGDFALDSHRRIFGAMQTLAAEGEFDLIMVRNALIATKELDACGGASYLAYLTEGIPLNFHVGNYVHIVKEKARQRDILALSHEFASVASTQDESSTEMVGRMRVRLDEITDAGADTPLETVAGFVARAQPDADDLFNKNAKSLGLLTPWKEINTLTCGFQPGDLIVLAGRPSMGKSAWAINLADYVTRWREKSVVVFSTEMSIPSMLNRFYCASARVDLQRLRAGLLTSSEKGDVLKARSDLMQAPLYLADQPSMTASRIRSKAARLKRTGTLDLIIVDQLSGVSRADCRERDRRLQVGEQTRAFKTMAQELGVPVILCNQLSRASTDRKDARPTLSDLKESGNLEEDADVVIFVHRPEYYDRNDQTLKGVGELIVAKQRNGPTDTASVEYNASLCLWKDSEQQEMRY